MILQAGFDKVLSAQTKYNRKKFDKGEIVLELNNLTKKYGEAVRVDNVSLKIFSGEIFGFLGPNGAGKTTTIRMIAGLHSITSGEALVCGYSIAKDFKKAVKNIGGIIENPEMYKYMTGWENLKYYAGLYGNISDDDILEVVRLVGMENRIHEKVKRYSLGMRQRVGIAQSLLHNPRLLILDEPTNGLDPAGIHEMRDFLKMLAHEFGIAVFISSHILTEMQLMCDRVGIINRGKIVAIKTMQEWMQSESAQVKLSLLTTSTEKAIKILSDIDKNIETSGDIIICNVPKEKVKNVSILLGKQGVSILSMNQGEKSLEETFLEITSVQGTSIS